MPTLTPPVPVPHPSYSQARERLVRAIPPRLLCLLACGGVDCRYEGPECWKSNQQAIRGLFSSWVTDDIIAMARPSNSLIERYNIIEQFKRLNIQSIINMQQPGEHCHCGPPLDPSSGFTYSPQTFMDNNIYFYNFWMPDFGVSSLVNIIDGVKVLAFAVREGRVAVHCHAGLGRTGVLIACYLIYTLRISPSEAVHFVRVKRPRSIQTRAQIGQVFDFARLLGTQLVQYPDLSLRQGAPFTLQHYLNRQALLLHGQEARTLCYTPKVVYLLCLRLSCLALGLPAPLEVHFELEKRSSIRALGRAVRDTLVSRQFLPLVHAGQLGGTEGRAGPVCSWDEPVGFRQRKRELLQDKRSYSDSDLSRITLTQICRTPQHTVPSPVSRAVAKALADPGPAGESVLQRSSLLQEELNSSECGWALLVTECDPHVLSCLLWTWLEKLKDPVLSADDITKLCSTSNNKNPISELKKAQRHTVQCLLRCVGTVSSLCPHKEDALLQRLLRALTRTPLCEVKGADTLMAVFRSALRDTFCNHRDICRA
ncbi:protein tyrosine phosphatase domain-containing protein 1 isoform X2 [Periophthalmus magnuspinnatus]|uniref:protein tyrosine phosphatase domain-containing protein 1 isoform X2 n=1 Tax=Periophthalmus magnuspinnatus TaxID=409849 RepID=UPI002436417E|nr:protein tyrosine phosphatase domain-containing protein 1 isoform X2 [Periophthalmus magnuspinnatus]